MAFYNGNDDSLKNDVISGLITAAGGYGLASVVKKNPDKMWPTGVAGAGGILAMIVRKSSGLPDWMQATLEGLGYLGLGTMGMAIAANTTTYGKSAPGPLQFNKKHVKVAPIRALPGVSQVSASPGVIPFPQPKQFGNIY